MSSPARRRPVVLGGVALSSLLVVVHMTNDAFSSMLAALLPSLQLRFGLSETLLATLVATLSFSSSMTQPIFGALADRFGRRLVGSLGVITSSGLLSLMAVAPSPWLLYALLLVGGFGSAAFHPSGTGLARDAAKGQRGGKGLAVGIFSAGGTLGLGVGPLVVGFLIMNDLLAYSPWLMAPGLVLGAAMYLLAPTQVRPPRGERPAFFDVALLRGPVGALALAGIMRGIAFVSVTNGLPLLLVNARGVAPSDPVAFWSLTVFSVAAGLGGILMGSIEGRFGRVRVIVGCLLAAVPALLSLLVLPPAHPVFYLAVALGGALVNGPVPLLVVSAQDLAPHAVGAASGLLMGFTWGTAGVLYVGIGALQEVVGIPAAMATAFLFLIPSAWLAWRTLVANRDALDAAPAD